MFDIRRLEIMVQELYSSTIRDCEVGWSGTRLTWLECWARQVMMVEFVSTNHIKKLNDDNYSQWSVCLKFYLRGKELWEMIDGSQITPPARENTKAYEKWDANADKALSALALTVEN